MALTAKRQLLDVMRFWSYQEPKAELGHGDLTCILAEAKGSNSLKGDFCPTISKVKKDYLVMTIHAMDLVASH